MTELQNIKIIVTKILEKVDRIDSIEETIKLMQKDIKLIKDLYISISQRLDREIIVLQSRTSENSKRLDAHDKIIQRWLATRY